LSNVRLFAELSPREQWQLHDFFRPSHESTDLELLAHRHRISAERPSLPHQAGRALVKFQERAAQYALLRVRMAKAPAAAKVRRQGDRRLSVKAGQAGARPAQAGPGAAHGGRAPTEAPARAAWAVGARAHGWLPAGSVGQAVTSRRAGAVAQEPAIAHHRSRPWLSRHWMPARFKVRWIRLASRPKCSPARASDWPSA
jgi:hypothetical protein